MADTISQLAKVLMERELRTNPEQFAPQTGFDLGLPSSGPDMKPISADRLATLGGLADAASTYMFLKRGTGKETNAMLGLTGNHPEATALGALGGLAATKGVTALLRKLNPKLAEAVAANLGALQTSYAVGNMGDLREGSSQQYQRAMQSKVIAGK